MSFFIKHVSHDCCTKLKRAENEKLLRIILLLVRNQFSYSSIDDKQDKLKLKKSLKDSYSILLKTCVDEKVSINKKYTKANISLSFINYTVANM